MLPELEGIEKQWVRRDSDDAEGPGRCLRSPLPVPGIEQWPQGHEPKRRQHVQSREPESSEKRGRDEGKQRRLQPVGVVPMLYEEPVEEQYRAVPDAGKVDLQRTSGMARGFDGHDQLHALVARNEAALVQRHGERRHEADRQQQP